jgi:hypothetical protein
MNLVHRTERRFVDPPSLEQYLPHPSFFAHTTLLDVTHTQTDHLIHQDN